MSASDSKRCEARIVSTTSTSPANTQRQERYVVKSPPMSGPAATATAPAEATSPYARGRPAWSKFDATSATIAGNMSAAPMPSKSDHPTISTARLGESDVTSEPLP